MQFSRLKRRQGTGGPAAPAGNSMAGYTITEFAVVLTVMGLMVGGVLKAEEMVENASLAATISQVQQYQAAVKIFEDKYNALPGDFDQAATYIAGGDVANGNGDGIIGLQDTTSPAAGTTVGLIDGGGCTVGSGAASTTPANEFQESRQFWIQLAAAGLISGIRAQTDADGPAATIGNIFPAAPLGGGAGWEIVNCLVYTTTGNAGEQNQWFRLGAMPADTTFHPTHDPSGINTTGSATAYEAYQLDSRFDDGIPSMGTVRTVSLNCPSGTPTGTPTDTYAVTTTGGETHAACVMYFRMQ